MLGLAAVAVLAFSSGAPAGQPQPTPVDPTEAVLASLLTAEGALAEIERAFDGLCREPVLLALELEPDCETGAITLKDSLFGEHGDSQLKPEAREDIRAAVSTYLERLRRMPALWESLEAIEIRGHTDPRAIRDAYSTNLVGSQQRALGVLLFLVGPEGLSDHDRDDLERLATVSGASFSRPPESCSERSRECYPAWRRVEIRPVLSESRRRSDWSRTVEDVRVVTQRTREKMEAEAR